MSTEASSYQYLVDNPQFPYCNGCGHTWINRSLAGALAKLKVKPTKVNLVSDIGCVGLVDKLFLTNTIHTTHGRSTAFASGLQIADEVLFDNDAIHVVMIGDGGATIGLLHLVEAAKLNANITVILHNNFVYGMTGGQNSGLTPEHFRTATTMAGSITPSIHIAKLLEAAHAGFIARKLATDKDLDDTIVDAINYKGFSLVEVIELCTGYATKWNDMSKSDIENILINIDSNERGNIVERTDRQSYTEVYKNNFPKKEITQKYSSKNIITVDNPKNIDKEISIVVAGSAGEGVQFASRVLIESALLHGLNVVQKNDNPVTIGTGFSISEVKFSSKEIYYSGVDLPDFILISSIDGLNRSKEFLDNIMEAEDAHSTILIDTSFVEGLNKYIAKAASKFTVISTDFRKQASNAKSINFVMLGYFYQLVKDLDFSLLETAINNSGKNSESIVENAKKGFGLNL